jgi:hypothetical protein
MPTSSFPPPNISSWVTLGGVLVSGYKIASGQAVDGPYPAGALHMQKPFFQRLGLDLAGFYEGTLNISIRPYTFVMARPQFTFPLVWWTELHPPETFSFSHCGVKYHEQLHPGWVYYPHPETKKAHFQDPTVIEIISDFLAGIEEGDPLEVVLDPAEIDVTKPPED